MITWPTRKEFLKLEAEHGTEGVAAFIASLLQEQLGYPVHVNCAVTTRSCYITSSKWADDLRLSDHTKYGSNLPMNVQLFTKPKTQWEALLDRGVRAAISGARRYKDVPTWATIKESVK